MKQLFILLTALVLLSGMTSAQQYLQSNLEGVYTYGPSGSSYCDPNFTFLTTFDVETINGDNFLDVAIGQNVRSTGGIYYYAFQDYNNGAGSFSFNSNILTGYSPCLDNQRINNIVFGKLRPSQPRMDLAIPRKDDPTGSAGTEIHYNTGSGIASSPSQTLAGSAVDATWGPFDYTDDLHDLAVTNGSGQVRIYRNLNNGYVYTSPYTFSISASKILLAQMDRSIYVVDGNRWDLVSVSGNTLSVRLNNGSNGFGTPQNMTFGTQLWSFAVADVNNDSYNDVVIGGYDNGYVVKLFLNNGSGTINTTPTWSTSNVPSNPIVVVGDMGSPGDAARNDGWKDIVVVGYEQSTKVFINQGSGSLFTAQAQQSVGPFNSYTATGKILLADVQNTGGVSVIVQYGGSSIGLVKHTGNPAPAPPKNVTYSGGAGQHPTIHWAPSEERDLAGYNVYRFDPSLGDNGLWVKLNTSLITSTSYTDNSITIGDPRFAGHYERYRVHAVDAISQESSPSNETQVFVEGPWEAKLQAIVASKPAVFALHPNFPNPFNPSTVLQYQIAEGGLVTLKVFDVLGRQVGTLVNEIQEAGYYSTTFDAENLSAAVYFARFTVSDELGQLKFSQVNKLILAK